MIERRYASEGEAVIRALRALSKSVPLTADQRFRDCPVCGSDGIATGEHTVEWNPDDSYKETSQSPNFVGEVWFTALKFRCPVCHLRLDSEAEIDAAGIETAWQIEGADWREYEQEPLDENAPYERWREERGNW